MLLMAGGIGTGRSRKAPAPEPFHLPINLLAIATIGQLLPCTSSARLVAPTCRAKASWRRWKRSAGGSNPVKVRQTQSNPVKVLFNLYPRGKAATGTTLCCGFPGAMHNQWWLAPVATSRVQTICNPQSAIRNHLFSVFPPLHHSWSAPPRNLAFHETDLN